MRTDRPRVILVGGGWIAQLRLQQLAGRDPGADFIGFVEPSDAAADALSKLLPQARRFDTLEAALARQPDGVVVSTPNALHAQQCLQALNAGAAVFCQKPLAATTAEAQQVVSAARACNALLGVDFCYRHLSGVQRMQRWVAQRTEPCHFELVFHNAYGPDKAWCYQRETAGGGCLLDLGVHLVDLALWLGQEDAAPRASGELVRAGPEAVETCAALNLRFPTGRLATINCSWNMPLPDDALIRFFAWAGDEAFVVENIDGSFFDFHSYRVRDRQRLEVERCQSDWGPAALLAWMDALAAGQGFQAEAARFVTTASVLDQVYGRVSAAAARAREVA